MHGMYLLPYNAQASTPTPLGGGCFSEPIFGEMNALEGTHHENGGFASVSSRSCIRNASVGVCLHCVYSCPRRRGECAVQGKGKGVSSPVAFTASLNYELSWIKSANRGMFFFITLSAVDHFFKIICPRQ